MRLRRLAGLFIFFFCLFLSLQFLRRLFISIYFSLSLSLFFALLCIHTLVQTQTDWCKYYPQFGYYEFSLSLIFFSPPAFLLFLTLLPLQSIEYRQPTESFSHFSIDRPLARISAHF